MADKFDEANLYTLVDEEGVEQTFEMLDAMEVDGKQYFALVPVYDDPDQQLEDDGELVVLTSEIVDGEEMMASIGEGLVITEMSGMHAGANPVSGDFSLLSKGYTIENGRKGRAVEQITVAGNFYTMLKNIREVGSDLEFFGSSYGSPSVDVGEMTVAGK